MSFRNKVDILAPLYSAQHSVIAGPAEPEKLQRQKWTVLLWVFVSVFLVAIIYVWSRPEVYQSKAILHFSYPQQLGEELSPVATEQIYLNQQRLTNINVLQSLSEVLYSSQGISLSVEQLANMLSATGQAASRTIALRATGHQPWVLAPVISTWISFYLEQIENEGDDNSTQELLIFQQELVILEEKITEQRLKVQQFATQNDIISLERDENRILNRLKGLGQSIDEAEVQAVEAQTALHRIQKALSEGRPLARPQDQESLAQAHADLAEISLELTEFAERFTPQYMALDPNVIELRRQQAQAKDNLQRAFSLSQETYLQDSKIKLQKSNTISQALRQQLDVLSAQAQDFNQKLNVYRRLDDALQLLIAQAQDLNQRIIHEQVQTPSVARVNVLERPFVPDFSIAPNYWLNSAIAAGVAAVIAVLSLLVFGFIVRQKNPAIGFTGYNVVSPQSQSNLQTGAQHSQLQDRRVNSQPVGKIQENGPLLETQTRLLSEAECQLLFEYANKQGKVAIALMLCGLSYEELENLRLNAFNQLDGFLNLPGAHSRVIALSPSLSSLLKEISAQRNPEALIWREKLDLVDFNQLLINAAHDSEIAEPEQLSIEALRRTYLSYLVTQGARLNDLENLAGYISPRELGQYRGLKRQGESIDIDKVDPIFPFVSQRSA